MRDHFLRIQHQVNIVADLARKVRQLRLDIHAMRAKVNLSEPISFMLVYILALIAIGAAWGFDVLMLRPELEFLASLAAAAIATIAIYGVPALLVLCETFVAVSKAKADFERRHLHADLGTAGRAIYEGMSPAHYRRLTVMLLCIQPIAALSMLAAINKNNPDMLLANLCLFGFLLLCAFCTHAIVLTSGPQLLSLAEKLGMNYRENTIKKMVEAYHTCGRQLEMGNGMYDQLVAEYASLYPNAPAPPQLDPVTREEILLLHDEATSDKNPPTNGGSPYFQN